MIKLFARKSHERLRRMIQAIRMGDFSVHFSQEKLRGAEKQLVQEMNDVVTECRQEILRQERQYGQYEAILNLVDSALIVTDANGKVDWMNKKAINNLCGFKISHISMLDALHAGFAECLQNLTPGQPRIVSFTIDGGELKLRLSKATYRREGSKACIYSIENVGMLVQQSEIDAQRKLVSVLTHEIMNSLSPIISLSGMLCDNSTFADEDSAMALQAINRRSQGLLKFVENYRQLTRLSKPSTHWTRIGDIFDNLRALYPQPFIHFDIEDDDIQLQLDSAQIEQVLINMIKNSMEACKHSPCVNVTTQANHPKQQFSISVADNGCGISADALDNIFVPFFTTKPGGSGIGLSLSQQIINMHGGMIRVASSPAGTTFTIILPMIYKV